jgi:hypothetical protein
MTLTLAFEIEEEIVIVRRPPRGRPWAPFYVVCALLLISLAALQAISLVEYARDQRRLTLLVNQIASPSLPPSQQAMAINDFLRPKSDRSNRQYYLAPIFAFLRPTAEEIARDGGDCADRSRLMIVLLGLRGIHATKWALYGPQMKPHHAVAELDSERGKMVIDPLFGLVFSRPEGGYYDIAALRRDSTILRQRVQELAAQNLQPGTAPVRGYPLNQYVYSNVRTINWEKSRVMHALYGLLHFFIGDRANYIARPGFVEQPALMIVYGAIIPEVCVLIALIGVARRQKKLSQREQR